MAERGFIELGVAQDIRCDGRGRLDFRCIEIEQGVLDQSNGSARVAFGSALGTDVLASVKASIAEPMAERPDRGTIEFNVEFAASASPQFEQQMAANLGAELAQVLECSFGQCGFIDANDALCIIPGQACWQLTVDLTVTNFGGNVTDAVVLAAHVALRNTSIPSLALVETEEGELDYELNADVAAGHTLCVDCLPLCITLARIGVDEKLFFVDAMESEETCAGSRTAVAGSRTGAVCGIVKLGGVSVGQVAMNTMLQTAVELSKHLFAALDSTMAEGAADPGGIGRNGRR